MTTKSAAFLALIGLLVLTVMTLWDLVFNVTNVMQGLAPAVILFRSILYAFSALMLSIFFFVFHKNQS